MLVRERIKKRVIIGIGVLVIASGFAGEAIRAWTKSSAAADLRGAPPQQGTATVVALYGAEQNVEGPAVKPGALVRFDGKLAGSKIVTQIARLKVGGPARITYRIGRSGKIYIDNVEPLPAEKP